MSHQSQRLPILGDREIVACRSSYALKDELRGNRGVQDETVPVDLQSPERRDGEFPLKPCLRDREGEVEIDLGLPVRFQFDFR